MPGKIQESRVLKPLAEICSVFLLIESFSGVQEKKNRDTLYKTVGATDTGHIEDSDGPRCREKYGKVGY